MTHWWSFCYLSNPNCYLYLKDKNDDSVPIPVLSVDDLPFVQSSWRFVKECLNELDNRDLIYRWVHFRSIPNWCYALFWNIFHNLYIYSSLVSSPFGAFPSLPTLDVHYCSQMKEMCRDNMVISLVKSARGKCLSWFTEKIPRSTHTLNNWEIYFKTELEHFAREAEFLCAKLIQVLRPTYLTYQGLEPPSLPTALPLTSYPLDYQPSESECF